MNPQQKYGTEFFCQPFNFRNADGSEVRCHDIGVCISPQHDSASTLVYAWEVFRELTAWVSEEFKDCPPAETYRIVIGWSQNVRKQQGHIIKIWCDLAQVREAAGFLSLEDCAARFGSGWLPFRNWQKDAFAKSA